MDLDFPVLPAFPNYKLTGFLKKTKFKELRMAHTGSSSSPGLFSLFQVHKLLSSIPNYSCDGLKHLIEMPGVVIASLLARFLRGIPLMLSSIKQNIEELPGFVS